MRLIQIQQQQRPARQYPPHNPVDDNDRPLPVDGVLNNRNFRIILTYKSLWLELVGGIDQCRNEVPTILLKWIRV